MTRSPAPSADVLSRLRGLPTAAIPDALDGITVLSDRFRVVGPAFTVRYAPVGLVGGTVGDFLDDVPAGAVVVVDNSAGTDVMVWGGIMSQVAAARGIGGPVSNGACRDVAETLTDAYPVFSCGRFMRTGKDRVRLESVGQPLSISGIDLEPGSILCTDADGVVAVPKDTAEQVAGAAEQIERAEAQVVAAVRSGTHLARSPGQVRLPQVADQDG